jgi:hypothetical protein
VTIPLTLPARAPRLALALALTALAAACGESAPEVSFDLDDPSAIVGFRGVTADPASAEPRTYVAVAARGGAELKLIDPADDRPVLGQTLVFPLSVPLDPHPVRLAAAPLGDGGADLLVAGFTGLDIDPDGLGAGAPVLRQVVTWEPQNRALADIPIPGLPAGAQLLSMIAFPVGTPEAPRARLVAGFATSGGPRLAVLDFVRGAPPAVPEGQPAPLAPVLVETVAVEGLPDPQPRVTLKPLAFDPLDLAVAPDASALFVATTDPVDGGAGLGVARLALGDPAADWTATPLVAGAGTTQVAAAVVAEVDPANVDALPAAAALRVYAALDPATCGDDRPIRCGVATLDPVAGALARDPLDPAAARLPVAIPGVVQDLVVAPIAPGRTVGTGVGERPTSAVAAAPSTNGNVYLLDLSRWGVLPDGSALRGDARTRIDGTAFFGGQNASTPAGVSLLLPGGAPATARNDLGGGFTVTPGFTPDDAWRLEWQGTLPNLVDRRGLLVRDVDQQLRLVTTAGGGVAGGLRIGEPALGVAVADRVAVAPTETTATCPPAAELSVVAVQPPDATAGAAFPGGALVLSGEGLDCVAATPVPVAFTVRAGGLVLSGASTGLARDAAGSPVRPVPGAPFAHLRERIFYVAEACAGSCEVGRDPFGPATAPARVDAALAFTPVVAPGTVRGAGISFASHSGLALAARRPENGSVPVAGGAAAVQVDPAANAWRFYASYADDRVFVSDPAQPGAVKSVR